ncbi:hypothetical protein N411_07175 [Helicobacter pylori FD535]|nr:hypothetical protein N411_07175 [Helicobacter pylori FD535]
MVERVWVILVFVWFLWGKPMKSLSLRDHSLGVILATTN